MILTDTHCHLFLPEFDTDRDEMISRSLASGVGRFFMPNVDSGTAQELILLAAQHPERCFPLMGLHPTSVEEDYVKELEVAEDWLSRKTFYGIGEIGLDFYWAKTFIKEQTKAFQIQLRWAEELNLPAIIHVRNSYDETIAAIKESGITDGRGIFHCFTGTVEQAHEVIDLGYFLGIGGVLTFKNSGLEPLIKEIDLSHIVLETDAPYLAPAPRRGKRNEPAFLRYTALRVAELSGRTLNEVAAITTSNSQKIFGI